MSDIRPFEPNRNSLCSHRRLDTCRWEEAERKKQLSLSLCVKPSLRCNSSKNQREGESIDSMGREKAGWSWPWELQECRTQQGHGVTVTPYSLHITLSARGLQGHWTNPLALLLSSQSPQCSRLLPALLRAYILMQETITKLIKIILLYSEVQYMKNWHKRTNDDRGERRIFYRNLVRRMSLKTSHLNTTQERQERVRHACTGGAGGDGGGFQMMETLQEVPNMSTRVKKKNKSTSIYVFIKKRKEKKETEITFSILIIAITTFLKATQKAKDIDFI